MCGRFVRETSVSELAEILGVERPDFECDPSYNIPPSSRIVVLMNDGRRRLALHKWGLVPRWAGKAGARAIINARAETLNEKPSFRGLVKKQRVVIPANGFYEWKDGSPYYLYPVDGGLIGFAGIYDIYIDEEGRSIPGCAIITTNANEKVGRIHDRMPAILGREDFDRWIDPDTPGGGPPLELLAPFPPEKIGIRRVSRKVNSPSFDSKECIEGEPVNGPC